MSCRPSLSTLVPLTAIALVAGACGTSPDAALTTVAPATVTPTAVVSASSPIPPSVATPETPPPTTEPTPTSSTGPALAEATDASTSSTTSTVDGAVPTLPNGEPVPGLSPDGPWSLVDGAPGVDGPGFVYELLPKLWVFLPTEESDDDGNLFVPSPADIPIIEAYVLARLTYYEALTTSPMDLTSPNWAAYYLDGGRSYFEVLEPRSDEGQVGDLDAGVLLRPRISGDQRTPTTALVLDCTLDGAVVRNADGSLAPGSTPGIVEAGLAAEMQLRNGDWLVGRVTDNVYGVCD